MLHSKSTLRLLCVVLFSLSLVVPALPGRVTSGAGRPAAAAADNNDDKDKKDDKDEKGERDPCRKALKRAAKGKPVPPECEPGGSGGAAKGDFNNDGFADLAVGVPFEDEDGIGAVGAVNIIYGSATGLTATGDQYFNETHFGISLATGDHFGFALAAGDFNGDDYSDLAIGMPDRNHSGIVNAGRVLLIDGSASGLNPATARQLSLLRGGTGRAGAALVWADFNGDGYGDLAVGIPDATVREATTRVCGIFEADNQAAGMVQVFYGGTNGLTAFGAQRLREGHCEEGATVGGIPRTDERFGSVLVAGDFQGDGAADLAVGVPFETNESNENSITDESGSVYIIPGVAVTGLRSGGTRYLDQDVEGVGGAAEDGDQFGRVLATGDFDGDSLDDLAVGIPYEDLTSNTEADAGAVQVFFGITGTDLVDAANDQFISQANLSGVVVEAGDYFGAALAVGQFDADGFDDIAIGVHGEDFNGSGIVDAGLVHVLYGSSGGPSTTRFQTWNLDTEGIPEAARPGDRFGYALSAWNYGSGSRSDLAIGIPFRDIVSASTGALQVDAGAVVVIYGNPTAGLHVGTPPDFLHQDSPGINDTAQPGDRFGNTLY